MPVRYLKIALVASIALLCLLYAAQNLANLTAAHGFVSAAVGMENHVVYPASFGPAITSPLLAWVILAVIIAGELAAGVVSAWGAGRLWKVRRADAATFDSAKSLAIVGAGIALLVWFGLFTAVGGAYFQMWQTELGAASLAGSFQYLASIGIVLLFVNMSDG